MNECVICRTGQRRPGVVTRTLQRGDVTVVVRNVPADVCDNCREPYFSEATVRELMAQFDAAVAAGVTTAVRDYVIGRSSV